MLKKELRRLDIEMRSRTLKPGYMSYMKEKRSTKSRDPELTGF